jgi:predicted transcriptional regulator
MEMSAQDIDDIVTKRRDVLAALAEDPATKPDLVERLDTSRSTVDRAIADLEAYDLVRRPGDHYDLTMAGKTAYERHQDYLADLSAIARARDIVASLSPEVPFSHELLADAEIELAEPHDPNQPLELATDIISDASTLRKVTPAIFPICVEVLKEQATDGLTVDLVVPADVVEALQTRYSEEMACFTDGDHQFQELPETPPYGLWIAETDDKEYVGLMPHSETGVRGLVVTDDRDALRWARDQYDHYRERATPVDQPTEQA